MQKIFYLKGRNTLLYNTRQRERERERMKRRYLKREIEREILSIEKKSTRSIKNLLEKMKKRAKKQYISV